MTFAKLFDTELGQVLATKEFEEGLENPFGVCLRGEDYLGVSASYTGSWPTLEERDAWFEALDPIRAESEIKLLRDCVDSMASNRE